LNLRNILFGGEEKSFEHMFDNIIGHEDIKYALMRSLKATKPVHVLLRGDVGLGKTEMLLDIANHFGKRVAKFGVGSQSTKAGIADLLIKDNPEFLIIDELETMKYYHQDVLLSVCEHGIVPEIKFKKQRNRTVRTVVYATTNETKRIKRALLSRFFIIDVKRYNRDEFLQVALGKLGKEGYSEGFITFVAEGVFDSLKRPNIRDVVQICRMANEDFDAVRRLVNLIPESE
jgi:Holliday junction DNA helicase RuvB